MAFDYIPLWDKYEEILEPLSDEELGRLVRAMLAYKSGADPVISGNERFVWPIVRRDIEQVREKYEAKVANGALGGRPKKTGENQEKPNETKGNLNKPNENQEKAKKTNINDNVNVNDKDNIISPNGENNAPEGAAPAKEAKKSFGQFGWVKLTESEYNRLLNDLGEAEVKRCIAYVDESAQSSGNKNRWRDWNLVIRRCHRDGWGRQASGKQIAPAPKTEDRRTAAASLAREADWLEQFLAEQKEGAGNA